MLTDVGSDVVVTARVLCTSPCDILWPLTWRSLVKVLSLCEFTGSLLDVAALLWWDSPASHGRPILCACISNAISARPGVETYPQLILGTCWSRSDRCQTHPLRFISVKLHDLVHWLAYLRCCHHQQSCLQNQYRLEHQTCVHCC
jgi:hypothetical protein